MFLHPLPCALWSMQGNGGEGDWIHSGCFQTAQYSVLMVMMVVTAGPATRTWRFSAHWKHPTVEWNNQVYWESDGKAHSFRAITEAAEDVETNTSPFQNVHQLQRTDDFNFSHRLGNRGFNLPIRSAECSGESPQGALSTWVLKYLNAGEANYLSKGGRRSVKRRGTHVLTSAII